jgi:hypothetical protein
LPLTPGPGDQDLDPMFADPVMYNFNLLPNSPCLATGRFGDDRGALPMVTSIDDDLIPENYFVANNYPNPFNASTAIRYNLPNETYVTVDVYDLMGRKIDILFKGNQQAGEHSIVWNASTVSSGVYFYKINAGDLNISKRCTLLK